MAPVLMILFLREGQDRMAHGYDFQNLEKEFVMVVDSFRGRVFDSHQFIRCFAKRYPHEYIDVLIAYKVDTQQPFRSAHSALAKALHNVQGIECIRKDAKSKDIFGDVQSCAKWKKPKKG